MVAERLIKACED